MCRAQGLNARVRRDILRRTWVPRGQALADLEAERGVRIRFVVGQSEQKDDPMELQVCGGGVCGRACKSVCVGGGPGKLKRTD